jgi:chromosomal replication initiation ATPase DnaA
MAQLVLPLETAPALGRSDFLVFPGNAQAVAFIDRWPDWPMPAALLHGPAASGKTHLAHVWAAASGATVLRADDLDAGVPDGAVVVEGADRLNGDREAALFLLLNRGTPLLLTAQLPVALWPVAMPDLRSRLTAMLSFDLGAPDEALLTALAVKLFADRQLAVSASVISAMLAGLDRTPGAIRGFIAALDAKALSEKRTINQHLIKEMLALASS